MLTGNTITCSRCYRDADIEDGSYNAIGKIVEVVRASAGGLDDLVAFQLVAKSVHAGTISREDASKQVQKIGSAWFAVWNWLGVNGTALGVVISILGLCIMYYGIIESDAGSDQAHSDAIAQSQAIEMQTQAIQTGAQAQQNLQEMQEKIYGILAQQQRSAIPQVLPASSALMKPQAAPPRTQVLKKAALNRHERRQAAKLSKLRCCDY